MECVSSWRNVLLEVFLLGYVLLEVYLLEYVLLEVYLLGYVLLEVYLLEYVLLEVYLWCMSSSRYVLLGLYLWRYVLLAVCPLGDMSSWRYVLLEVYLLGYVLLEVCPLGDVLLEICPLRGISFGLCPHGGVCPWRYTFNDIHPESIISWKHLLIGHSPSETYPTAHILLETSLNWMYIITKVFPTWRHGLLEWRNVQFGDILLEQAVTFTEKTLCVCMKTWPHCTARWTLGCPTALTTCDVSAGGRDGGRLVRSHHCL